MKKRPSIGSLKKKAWRVFSEYIRRRDCDDDGYNTCVTCSVKYPWKELHAGHFIHGHSKPTFLVEENVHPQCVKCNHFLSGNLIEYTLYMQERYGLDKVQELRRLSRQVIKFDRSHFEDIIEHYRRQNDNSHAGC